MSIRKLAILAALSAAMTGCAAFPTFPTNDGSRAAETAWLALDAIDTAQTVQFTRHPACYHEADPFAARLYGSSTPPPGRVLAVNTVLALVHPAVSRWFDDHAEAAYEADDDTVGLWYVGRGLWHLISIAASAKSVANNFGHGITPFGARCDASQ